MHVLYEVSSVQFNALTNIYTLYGHIEKRRDHEIMHRSITYMAAMISLTDKVVVVVAGEISYVCIISEMRRTSGCANFNERTSTTTTARKCAKAAAF